MKCIKEKCEKYFFSDHRGSCILTDRYIHDDNECELDDIIKIKETNLNLLKQLKQKNESE